jgi:hypothetical protein
MTADLPCELSKIQKPSGIVHEPSSPAAVQILKLAETGIGTDIPGVKPKLDTGLK